MKKLLLVIDYQNDFVSGSLGFEQAVSLEDPICRKIESYLKNGDDIIFTLDTHGQDYSSTQEGKKLPVPHCLKGSDGWKVYGKAASYLSKAAAVRFYTCLFPCRAAGRYGAAAAEAPANRLFVSRFPQTCRSW